MLIYSNKRHNSTLKISNKKGDSGCMMFTNEKYSYEPKLEDFEIISKNFKVETFQSIVYIYELFFRRTENYKSQSNKFNSLSSFHLFDMT